MNQLIMKSSLLLTLLLAVVQSSLGQGTINVLNTIGSPPTFRAPIYEWDGNITPVSGQGASSTPSGNTVYTAPLLSGTGFTFAVYAGAASVTDPNTLTLLVTAPFRTGGAVGLIAPIPAVVVPGVQPGERIKFQIRAWDNGGGTLNYFNAIFKQSSSMVSSAPLGGMGTDGTVYPTPITDGWTSFGLWYVPEPPAWALGGLGAAAMFVFARRRNRS